jgi:hypothetical protein
VNVGSVQPTLARSRSVVLVRLVGHPVITGGSLSSCNTE